MEISLPNMIVPAVLIASRISGFLLYAPVLGSASVPPRIKIVLVLALTALLYSTSSKLMVGVDAASVPLIMAKEAATGLGLGIAANFVFDAAQFAGQMLSIQVGYSLVNILDPTTQAESTVMALFHQMIATLIFLRLDVHLWMLRTLAESFQLVPPQNVELTGRFASAVIYGAAGVFGLGVQIAAPVLMATLVADFAIGMLGKAAPQMQSLLLGSAVKSVLGVFVLATALIYWPSMFERMFAHSMEFTEQLIHLAHA